MAASQSLSTNAVIDVFLLTRGTTHAQQNLCSSSPGPTTTVDRSTFRSPPQFGEINTIFPQQERIYFMKSIKKLLLVMAAVVVVLEAVGDEDECARRRCQ